MEWVLIDKWNNETKLNKGRNRIGSNTKLEVFYPWQLNKVEIEPYHAVIVVRGSNDAVLIDLSNQGTYLNEQKLNNKSQLNEEDVIRMGTVECTITKKRKPMNQIQQ